MAQNCGFILWIKTGRCHALCARGAGKTYGPWQAFILYRMRFSRAARNCGVFFSAVAAAVFTKLSTFPHHRVDNLKRASEYLLEIK